MCDLPRGRGGREEERRREEREERGVSGWDREKRKGRGRRSGKEQDAEGNNSPIPTWSDD
jgi:hypothetical protein